MDTGNILKDEKKNKNTLIGYCILANENYIKHYCKSVISRNFISSIYMFLYRFLWSQATYSVYYILTFILHNTYMYICRQKPIKKNKREKTQTLSLPDHLIILLKIHRSWDILAIKRKIFHPGNIYHIVYNAKSSWTFYYAGDSWIFPRY